MPAIDVVMPCFNAEMYIQEALDSVFSQSLPAGTVVVVDDGSTDSSASIAGRFGKRVLLIRQPNAGISAARNAGLAACSSPLVAFLDADDIWPIDSLERRYEYLYANPQMNGVFASLQNFLSPELDAADAARYRVDLAPAAARFPGTLLVQLEAFRRIGGFDVTLKVGEMIEWIARAAASGLQFGAVDSLALLRRIHGNNTTLKAANSRAGYLDAVRAALQRRKAGQ